MIANMFIEVSGRDRSHCISFSSPSWCEGDLDRILLSGMHGSVAAVVGRRAPEKRIRAT